MSLTLTMLVCVVGVIIPGLLALLILGNPLWSMLISLCALLIGISCVLVVVVIRPQQRELQRRLNRVAAALKGGTLPAAHRTGGSVSVFREQRSKSRLVERLEHQFSMIDVRKALPKAAWLGVLGALATGLGAALTGFGLFAMLFFLLAGGLGCSWAVLAMQDTGQRNEFTKIFPETTDQVVRLVRAGVPSMEAISIVAQDAPPPVNGVMSEIASTVAAGLDPETAVRGTAARIRIPAFSLFSAAICLQMTTGGGISGALGNLSATLRARHDVTLKARSSTSQTRLTLAIISLVPVVVLAIQNFTNPSVIGDLVPYGVGRHPAPLRSRPYSNRAAGRPHPVRPRWTVSHVFFCIVPLLRTCDAERNPPRRSRGTPPKRG